ncbi:TetR/AcrR family transcriptional regulator [Virgisporangium aurantiacum]|uniref:TetR family transcriptional regulator n=1 Tax=Virgisporangium aurantiacum TaxID=175570 RepID=A0A8J4E5D2_9ACTN|nr:TetR/AcrR family transcriptional regulator [Virgisporangium aurantiacum]GIJ61989.1 TetR family transcriptional regulator [Virgisporangium aurantiacum]
MRADAQRNRDRILEVAVEAFTRDGDAATLDAIAKDAGVGIGTLYRHFPTREALVDAAYQNELGRLCDAADDLLADLPPDEAIRAWMDRFVDYMTTKRGMGAALRALIAAGGDPFARSWERMLAATTTLLRAAVESRKVRDDVDPDDVLRAVGAVALATVTPDQAGRLLDLIMDGLRYQPAAP